MRKKILFCLQTMIRGGVEKELLTILPYFSKEKYSVSVLIMYDSDKEISDQVSAKGANLINLDIDKKYYCSSTKNVIFQRMRKGHFIEAVKIAILQGIKVGYTGSIISLKNIPSVNEHYDIAVCYHMHSQITVKYIAEKIKATHKYIWMHNDFSSTLFNPKRIRKLFPQYEYFVGCSKKVTNEFSKLVPECADRAITIHNILDVDEIINMSEEQINDIDFTNRHGCTIMTIGRYEPQKAYDDAINVCNILSKRGVDFSWYTIGYGSEEEKLKKMIAELNLENKFYLLGKKSNPYPYLKKCDIYVQSSRHEGYALTILEAKIFNKPIVTTDFTGVREQLIDRYTGSIVPVGDLQEMANKICELIQDNNLRLKYSNNLANEISQTEKSLQDLFALF